MIRPDGIEEINGLIIKKNIAHSYEYAVWTWTWLFESSQPLKSLDHNLLPVLLSIYVLRPLSNKNILFSVIIIEVNLTGIIFLGHFAKLIDDVY